MGTKVLRSIREVPMTSKVTSQLNRVKYLMDN